MLKFLGVDLFSCLIHISCPTQPEGTSKTVIIYSFKSCNYNSKNIRVQYYNDKKGALFTVYTFIEYIFF